MLTRGKVALIDKEDSPLILQHKWQYSSSSAKRANTNQEYAKTTINGKAVKMHRLIINAPEGMDVDHINGNQLDNRKLNLRICSRIENLRNSKKYKRKTKCSSVYKGVSWHKKAGKWEAGLQFEGKRIWLGLFEDEIEAAKSYDSKAKELFKEFCKTNF